MSNFVHKVKDAITDHDKPVTRSQTSTNPNQTSANPFTTSGYDRHQSAPQMSHEQNTEPGFNRSDHTAYGAAPDTKTRTATQYEQHPRGAAAASEASQPGSDIRNSTFSPDDDVSSSATSSSSTNAGPHQSKLANKLDPRVDSDTGNRAQQAPASLQRENAGNQGMSQSNMPQQPGFGQGVDNHSSSEDTFSKSTQEHRHSNQPTGFGFDGNQVAGEAQEDFSTSTEEHKSHKATSHVSPCASGQGMGSGQMLDNSAKPNFGGNSTGDSSYNRNVGAGGPGGGQDATTFQKPGTGADTNLPAGQQNMGGDQRVRY